MTMPITAEQFAAQRHPERGLGNPESMDRPVWTWLVETGLSAYRAAASFGAPSALRVGPGWCFDRFGCSKTVLPDGRILRIAGEHEDYYDPDFYIYERDDCEREADNTRYDESHLRIGDTLVRYADDGKAIAVKIEGLLSEADTNAILDDLVEKLGRLQGSPCEATRLD
jgi:hypothetical protein